MMRFLSFIFPVVLPRLYSPCTSPSPGLSGWLKPYDFVFTWAQPLAVLWILIMTGANYLGVRLGGAVQVFLTSIKIMFHCHRDCGRIFFARTGRARLTLSGRT